MTDIKSEWRKDYSPIYEKYCTDDILSYMQIWCIVDM